MVQTARPDGPDTDGTWSSSSFNTLWEDTSDQSDSTYAQLSSFASNDEFIVTIDSLTDPSDHTGHTITMRAAIDASSQSFTLKLYEGATVRKSASHTVSSSSFSDFTTTLSETEASGITDYTNLKIGVTASFQGFGEPQVAELSFEVPDAGGGGGGGEGPKLNPEAFLMFL